MPDNRKFWKTIKLYFSNKGLNSNKLLLTERDKLFYNENKLASTFGSYSENITPNLILKNPPTNKAKENLTFLRANNSVKSVRVQIRSFLWCLFGHFSCSETCFNFIPITSDQVRKEILNHDGSKATMRGDISADILNWSIEVHLLKSSTSHFAMECFQKF